MRRALPFLLLCQCLASACAAEEPPEVAQRTPLALGYDHSCVVLPDGGVACWGGGALGQVGHGAVSDSSTPVRALGVRRTAAIAAAWYHTCALDAGGTVLCWGGIDSDAYGGFLPVATPVERGRGAMAITAGSHDACELAADGSLACVRQSLAPIASDAVEVAIGARERVCWRTALGDVECRGDGDVGAIPELAGARAITLHREELCALDGLGTVRCLDLADRALHTVLDGAVALSTGMSTHSCAISRGGAVLCWGSNFAGQLGDGSRTDSDRPRVVRGIDDAVAVATGPAHTCAIRAAGRVACWGANRRGQLGDGTTVDRSEPVEVARLDLATPDGAVGPEAPWTEPRICLLQDSDGDFIEDEVEGSSDWDGDGMASMLDLDSDGDAIPDAEELGAADACDALARPRTDCDLDGLPPWYDADSDDDGVGDAQELALGLDSCLEDTDDDGCPDIAMARDGACRDDTTYELVNGCHECLREVVLHASRAAVSASVRLSGADADRLASIHALVIRGATPETATDPTTGDLVDLAADTDVRVRLDLLALTGRVEALELLEGAVELVDETGATLDAHRMVVVVQPHEAVHCDPFACLRPACNYRCPDG